MKADGYVRVGGTELPCRDRARLIPMTPKAMTMALARYDAGNFGSIGMARFRSLTEGSCRFPITSRSLKSVLAIVGA